MISIAQALLSRELEALAFQALKDGAQVDVELCRFVGAAFSRLDKVSLNVGDKVPSGRPLVLQDDLDRHRVVVAFAACHFA